MKRIALTLTFVCTALLNGCASVPQVGDLNLTIDERPTQAELALAATATDDAGV